MIVTLDLNHTFQASPLLISWSYSKELFDTPKPKNPKKQNTRKWEGRASWQLISIEEDNTICLVVIRISTFCRLHSTLWWIQIMDLFNTLPPTKLTWIVEYVLVILVLQFPTYQITWLFTYPLNNKTKPILTFRDAAPMIHL